jgi:hypothetical protein
MRLSIPQILVIGCIVTAVVWVFAMSLQSVSDEDPLLPVTPTTSIGRTWGQAPQPVPAPAPASLGGSSGRSSTSTGP